jgi:hypothetical protein
VRLFEGLCDIDRNRKVVVRGSLGSKGAVQCYVEQQSSVRVTCLPRNQIRFLYHRTISACTTSPQAIQSDLSPSSMHRTVLVLLLGTICDAVYALRSGRHCFGGCELTLDYVNFNDTDPSLSRKRRSCQSMLHTISLFLCIDNYCTAGGRERWLRTSNETCETTTNETLPPFKIIDTWSSEDVARLRRLRAEEGMWNSEPLLLGEIVIPDEAFFERGYKTLVLLFRSIPDLSLTFPGLRVF